MDNECNNCIVRLYGIRGFNVNCKMLITAADIQFFVLLIIKQQFHLPYKYTTVNMGIYNQSVILHFPAVEVTVILQ